ncbi:MAG: hypothetical protein WBB52_09810, partial [Acidimicrobiales bacterium]
MSHTSEQDPPIPTATDLGAEGSDASSRGPMAEVRSLAARPMVRAVGVGVLVALSLPPWGWWPLAFAGLALADRLLAGAGARQRLGRGFVAGLALFTPTISWISQLTFPGYIIATLA